MKPKYIAYGLIALSVIIGWNAFLVQRDDALFRAYYKQQALENLKVKQ
jgi:hypothetical protein